MNLRINPLAWTQLKTGKHTHAYTPIYKVTCLRYRDNLNLIINRRAYESKRRKKTGSNSWNTSTARWALLQQPKTKLLQDGDPAAQQESNRQTISAPAQAFSAGSLQATWMSPQLGMRAPPLAWNSISPGPFPRKSLNTYGITVGQDTWPHVHTPTLCHLYQGVLLTRLLKTRIYLQNTHNDSSWILKKVGVTNLSNKIQ